MLQSTLTKPLCLPSQKKSGTRQSGMQWRTTRVCVFLGAPKVSVHFDGGAFGGGGEEGGLSCFWVGRSGVRKRLREGREREERSAVLIGNTAY